MSVALSSQVLRPDRLEDIDRRVYGVVGAWLRGMPRVCVAVMAPTVVCYLGMYIARQDHLCALVGLETRQSRDA